MELTQEKDYTEDDYYNLPEDVRAELIDGRIYYMASPSQIHQTILTELLISIHAYIQKKGGGCHVFPAPFDVKLYDKPLTVVQPDLMVVCDPGKLDGHRCNGAPDWIIEIVSPGNPGHDYIRKLNLYADAGVREYWIVDPESRTILVYTFGENNFHVQQYTFQDKVKANIYDELFINFAELNL